MAEPLASSSDISVEGGTISITSGLYDTDDGITLKVAGDAEPRIRITPQGEVKTGDGTEAPANLTGTVTPQAITATYDAGSSAWLATIPSVAGAMYDVAAIDDSTNIILVFIVPDRDATGYFSAVVRPPTDNPVSAIGIADSGGADWVEIGAIVNQYTTGGGASLHFQNAGEGWTISSNAQKSIFYDNTASGLSARSVQGALDELAALIAALP